MLSVYINYSPFDLVQTISFILLSSQANCASRLAKCQQDTGTKKSPKAHHTCPNISQQPTYFIHQSTKASVRPLISNMAHPSPAATCDLFIGSTVAFCTRGSTDQIKFSSFTLIAVPLTFGACQVYLQTDARPFKLIYECLL